MPLWGIVARQIFKSYLKRRFPKYGDYIDWTDDAVIAAYQHWQAEERKKGFIYRKRKRRHGSR